MRGNNQLHKNKNFCQIHVLPKREIKGIFFFKKLVPLRWPCQQERSPRMLKVACSNPGGIITKIIKQVVTTTLPNARQQVRVSRNLGEMFRVTVGVAR